MTGCETARIIPFPVLAEPDHKQARNDLAASAARLSAALDCLSMALADQQAAIQQLSRLIEVQAAAKPTPQRDESLSNRTGPP